MFLMRWLLFVSCVIALWIHPIRSSDANKSGASPQVLSLPSGPGSLGGIGENVQANLNMGLMSYSIGIIVPKGRGAATPNPSVTYSSSAGAGLMGIGWDFDAGSSIERGTVRGLPTYTNADIFFAGGELVKIPGGPFYRSRYEGAFMRHRWVQKDASDQQGYWIVESPDGSKLYYGANAKGEIDLNAQTYGLKGTYCWKLVTMVDRNGNRVEYSYFKDGTQSYMEHIAWVFDKSNKPLYQLKFNYEERPDHISDGKPGFDLKTTKRIKEIRITSDGTRFRSYHFDFEDSTGLSRLIKVTRYGRDATKAYPVAFTMKYSDAVFSPENSKMVTMPTSLGVDFRSGNIDFLDINGDGLPDVVDTSKPKHLFFINEVTLKDDIKQDGHDFPKGLIKENLKETSAQLSNPSIQMLDYNGDGFTDMVDAVNKKIYINKGNSQWEDSSTSLQTFPVTGKDPNMRFMDYDGDKKIDVISSDGATTTFWVSDGKGNWVVTPGKVNIGLGFEKDKLRLIDINGDGLQDIVHITKNSLRYRKYLGYGEWTDWIDVKVPGIDQYELSTQAQFDDINGDGMADMVAFLGNSIVYFVNKNGVEFEAGKKLETFKGVDIPDSSKMTIRIVDINGNGSRDIVWIDSSGRVTYLELFGKRPNLMTAISNGIGQRINVEYGSSVNFYLRDKVCQVGVDKACEGPWQNKMPMPFTVVTKITTWASRSEKPLDQAAPTAEERPMVQEVYYHNGFYDGVEKTFRGFRKVENIEVGDDSIMTKRSFIEYNVGDTDGYFHGRMLRSVVVDDSAKIYTDSKIEYKDCGKLGGVELDLDPPVRFICQSGSENLIKEGLTDSSKWKTTRSEVTYDGYGNVVVSANLGEKGKEGDELYTRSTFIVPADPKSESSSWNIRAIQKAEHCAKADGPCAVFKYFYDGEAFKGLPEGQLTRGNLTRVSVKTSLTEDSWVEPTRNQFDSYGNVVEVRGPTGQRRTAEWDAVYHRFAVKETVYVGATSYAASVLWDYATSTVLRSTTFNGQVYRYTYDTFGRILSVFMPGDADDKPTSQFEYDLTSPMSRIITKKRTQREGEFDRKSIKCFDGLGRTVSERAWLGGDRYLVMGHTTYNARGQRALVWRNYTAKEACTFAPPTEGVVAAARYKYDLMGRLLEKKLADDTMMSNQYLPFVAIHRDPEDRNPASSHFETPTTETFDGLGRLIQYQVMASKTTSLITKYTYNSVNALRQQLVATMTYPNGKVKKHEYDLLGNITRIIEPDQSTMEMKYDTNSRLIEKKDARGEITVYTYDGAGRMLTRQKKGDDQTRITYVYDAPTKDFPEATHLKGRLAAVISPLGATYASYDVRGQQETVRRILMGVRFDIKRTFNWDGELVSVAYPDGRSIAYKYDQVGRLVSMPGYLKEILYADNATASSYLMANGVKTDFAYDTNMRINSLRISSNPGFQYDLSFDLVGNITSTKERYGNQETQHRYTYDALYRLTKADLGGATPEVLSYQLDREHNITSKLSSLGSQSKAHVGAYQYSDTKSHAATQAGNIKLQYDNAGYLQSRDALRFSWDHLGRMTQVQDGQGTIAQNWYGLDFHRVMKEERGLHSLYPWPEFRLQDGYVSLYLSRNHHKLAEWRSTKMLATFFDDVVADGKITSADSWRYYAAKKDLIPATLKPRPVDVDLTKDMLAAAAYRMLSDDKDEVFFLHTDHLGSVRLVTDAAGKVVKYQRYYPYGAIQKQEGHHTSLGFQGSEWDASIGMNYFGARHLDPVLAKWISLDPAFESAKGKDDEWNRYASMSNNPLRFRDREGMYSESTTHWVNFSAEVTMAVSSAVSTIASSVFLFRNHQVAGKGLTTGKKALVAIGLINTALYATAAVYRGSGLDEVANVLEIVGSATVFVKQLGVMSALVAKYQFIEENQFVGVSRLRRNTRIALSATSALAGIGSSVLVNMELGLGNTEQFIAMSSVLFASGAATLGAIYMDWGDRKKYSSALKRAHNQHKLRNDKHTKSVFSSKARIAGNQMNHNSGSGYTYNLSNASSAVSDTFQRTFKKPSRPKKSGRKW